MGVALERLQLKDYLQELFAVIPYSVYEGLK